MKQKAIFLDRDGVINSLIMRNCVPRAPYELDELRILPGVAEAVSALKDAGYVLVIVTNQPDAVRGWVSVPKIEALNRQICRTLGIEHLKVCYHDRSDLCDCRKPMPGMLLSAATELELELADSYMIGDRFSDIQAGSRAGCRTILIGAGDPGNEGVAPDYNAENLYQASLLILSKSGTGLLQPR